LRPFTLFWWNWALNVMKERNWSVEYFYFVFGLTTLLVQNIICNLFFLVCYRLKSPFIERYKVLEDPWPWESDPEAFRKFFWKTMKLYFVNMVGFGGLGYAQFYLFDIPLLCDVSPSGVPSTYIMIAQTMFCMMMEDFTFHFSHRFLHWKRIYPYIHKIHHEYNITISISAQYAHPLEFVFGNLLPTAVGPLILGKKIHFTTLFVWYVLRHFESIDGHSGYEFSFSPFRMLPFASDYGYHVYHHSHNIGNFSSAFTIWDTVFGSNTAYFEYIKEKHAAEE